MMAFATKNLKILYKVCTGGGGSTTRVVLGESFARTFPVRSARKRFYTTENERPRIAGSLTNIRSTGGSIGPFATVGTVDKTKLGSEESTDGEDAEDQKKREQQWRMMKYSFIFFGVSVGLSSSILIYKLAGPRYDENGDIVEDEFSNLSHVPRIWKRLRREMNYYKKFVQEPSREKLLPDPLEHPYIQPPYTLVLEMTDVLVHPDWTYRTGWRFKKRPGLDQFLEAIAPPQFEIVVYTAEQGMTVFPILDSLDPQGYIMYRLVRDATRFVDGHHVKDLDALNRDLSKVIVIDWNGESIKYHPENALKIPRWTGNDDDALLHDLAAFLKTILASNVGDVRDVLNYYRQFDNPLEAFRENQRKLMQQMKEDELQKTQREGNKVLTSKWTPSFLRNRSS